MPYIDFIASGSFVVPGNVSGPVRIQGVGRGGDGANGNFGGSVAGGGGGGGAYSYRAVELIVGRAYTITIDNTASRFIDSVTGDILVYATKGGNASGATPGSGGSLSNAKGDIKKIGGDGALGFTIVATLAGGGGGGAAGDYSNNGAVGNAGTETNNRSVLSRTPAGGGGAPNVLTGTYPTIVTSGSGGGGNGGIPASSGCSATGGSDGVAYGGGGGGGSADSGGSVSGVGGTGGGGLVRVEYDISFIL